MDMGKIKKKKITVQTNVELDEEIFNDKRIRYCYEYIKDLNQTKAAERAGYGKDSASAQSSKLMAIPEIKSFIRYLLEKKNRRLEITAERITKELAKIAFSDIKDFAKWKDEDVYFVDSEDLNETDSAVISEIGATKTEKGITMKLKFHPKIDALKQLMEYVKESEIPNDEKRVLEVRFV